MADKRKLTQVVLGIVIFGFGVGVLVAALDSAIDDLYRLDPFPLLVGTLAGFLISTGLYLMNDRR